MLSSRQVNIYMLTTIVKHNIYICIVHILHQTNYKSKITSKDIRIHTYPILNGDFMFPSHRTSYTITLNNHSTLYMTDIYIYVFNTNQINNTANIILFLYITVRVKQKLHIKCCIKYFYYYFSYKL